VAFSGFTPLVQPGPRVLIIMMRRFFRGPGGMGQGRTRVKRKPTAMIPVLII
jgi:hypothetical protein